MDFILIIILLFPNTMAVKIGVSKTSSTSTTTLAPNTSHKDLDATVTYMPTSSATAIFETESLSSAVEANDISTASPKFPPKLTIPTKKTATTSKPITSTPTSTPHASSTTQTPTIDDMNSTALAAKDSALVNSNSFYCSCDLLPSICDINCCCDRDCPKAILKVFDCFTRPKNRLLLEDFQYEHGLPSCKINDGWLCVFRTNRHQPEKKVQKFDFDSTHNFKWRTLLMELTESVHGKEHDFYKYGDQLKVFNMDTLEVQSFEVPISFKPPFCQLIEPIRHLISTKRKCLVTTLVAAQEIKQTFLNFAVAKKLLSKPRDHRTDLETFKDLAKDFKLKSCIRSNEAKNYVCQELSGLDNETDTRDIENIYVSEIRIKVLHNFTDLIECHIEFIEQDLPPNEGPLELWQKFDVIFVAANGTDFQNSNDKDLRSLDLGYSGPLGYLQGEPVIVAKFIPNNTSEELSLHNRVLDYFKSPRIPDNTLNLPSRRTGLCHNEYGKDHSISYGVSSLTQCTLRLDKGNLARSLKKGNFTDVCVELQRQIFETLFDAHIDDELNDLTELYVSSLGHPQNSSEKWLPLIVHNLEFPPISGHLVTNAQTLICRNILLNAAFEIHIGTFTENAIDRQLLVKNAVLKLGLRHDLEFMLDEEFEVPLTLTVIFFDLSLSTSCYITAGTSMYFLMALTTYSFGLI